MPEFYSYLGEQLKNGRKAVLCIVVKTSGSTPRKAGARMIVFSDSSIYGTIGGGMVEKMVIDDAMVLLEKPAEVLLKSYDLTRDSHMHCGGNMEVFFEPIGNKSQLYIFGSGHVGNALAGMASWLGFNVTLFDNREEMRGTNPPGTKQIIGDYHQLAEELMPGTNDYLVSLTHGHAFDEEVVAACANKAFAYIGMIGSRKKVALAKKRFAEEFNIPENLIERIDMPIGIPINAETPAEIAVSILAKLIDVKNSGER
jgi:xanthine dehydrogenase accessory factor